MAGVSDAASLELATPRLQLPRLELISVLGTLLLLVVGAVVLYPLGLILYQSFSVPIAPGQTQLGLEGWQAVFGEASLRTAISNTLQLALVRQIVALPVAVVYRPGRAAVECRESAVVDAPARLYGAGPV